MSLLYKHKALTLSFVAMAVLVAVIGHFKVYASGAEEGASSAAPAYVVDVAEVDHRSITEWQTYSGRLEAVEKVDIRPLVSGTLMAVHFKEGDLVKKGDPLFTIDPRPYAAEVARAQAQLTAAEARVAYTASELARAQRLIADNAIAKRDFEERQNAALEAEANRQMAIAVLNAAKLNLGYTKIAAPVAGRISRTEITPGNVVSAGANAGVLTTLVSVSKVYASFDVDEQSFLKHINASRVDNGVKTPVYLGLANEDGHPRQGKINLIDNRLDSRSGTIRIRAEFDNAEGNLIPGLYARIRLGSNGSREAVLINEKAVGTDQDKRYVLVVDENNKTSYREVRLGAHHEGMRVVESGLKAGERIIVNGLQRVRPGDVINPQLVAMNPVQDTASASQASTAETQAKQSKKNNT